MTDVRAIDDLAGTKYGISLSDKLGKTKKSGFFYGYIIILAGFVVLTIMGGTQSSFGVFFKPVLTEFGWTRAVLSGAYSLNMIMQGASAIIAYRLSDRFGPRVLVTVCGLFLGLAYLLMSQISAVWQIYFFYGVLASIGSGSWVLLLSMVARWFVKRRGLTSAIVASGIGAGTVIMPPIANRLVSSYNWRTSYIIIGLVALLITMIAAQFLKRDPSQMGQLAYGADEVKPENQNSGISGFSFKEAISTRQFWIMSLALVLFGFCVQVTMVHVVPHATDIGVSAADAANILSVVGVLSIVGRIGLGSAGDRTGNKAILVTVFVLISTAFLWLRFASQLWMFYFFAIVFALGWGGMSATQSPLVAEFFGLKAHGSILGLTNFGISVGCAIGPLVAGRVFDITGDYYLIFVVCATVSIISLIMALLLKPIRTEGSVLKA